MINKNQNLTVLKRCVATLILLILSVFLGSPVAYAENEKLRVYYSEPIGAGEKVYHLTACNWVRAYEPLVCSEENATISPQCKYKEGDKKDEVKKGTRIMGCTHEEDDGEKYEDDAKMYLNANVDDYDNGKCKDNPELQDYKYGPVWAVVDDSADEDGFYLYKWTIQGTVVVEGEDEKPMDDIVEKIYKGGKAYPFFKTNLCATWDTVVEDNNNKGSGPPGLDVSDPSYKQVEKILNEISPEDEALKLIDEGCNNDNSKEALPIVTDDSASPIPLVHCSLVERITGDTGTDIFSQYVGALYKWAVGIVGIVTVLIMVASGIQISMAGGDSAKIDSAKNRIMQSIIGLVILFLAGLILYTINPGFFTG